MNDHLSRRDFVKQAGAAAALGLAASGLAQGQAAEAVAKAKNTENSEEVLWAALLHLGYNMWSDRKVEGRPNWHATDKLRCQTEEWRHLTNLLAKSGGNMLVIDIGEGMQYKSHPELAVEGSWSRQEMKDELARIRDLGLEPIPKLNFSATHDIWLGPYSRMLSTEKYYEVCRDLISETIEVFDGPRFFHLGMDEETAGHQRHFRYAVIRQYDLWWRDFLLLVDAVEENGSRAWIWSDYVWNHPDLFWKNMPKSVLQSNWYYGTDFSKDNKMVQAYDQLDAHGYEQIPTGSNWSNDENFMMTMKYCREQISPENLRGFLMAPWKPTMEKDREHHENAIAQLAAAKKAFKQA